MEEKKFWVALSTHPKIGARTLCKLYKRFKTLSKVWSLDRQTIASAGIESTQVEAALEVVAKVSPDQEMLKLERLDIQVLILSDENYPALLKEIPDPPGILYYRGQILPADDLGLAIVGSRKYTDYGERVVDKLVGSLSVQNLTIVSGLALGIDTLAHKAALNAGGRTLAVLGCGLDQVYPTANIHLADRIIQGRGAIISEFPLGTPAYRSNFPIRNRIVAGLTLGTLVVEGTIDSGSLITAQAALDYNREVFAVPGSIFSDASEGPNKLIQMGAKLVSCPEDIFSELNINQNIQKKKIQTIIADSPNEKIVLNLLKSPILVDELIKNSKLAPSLVNTTLVMLEMKGMIKNLGGTRYVIRGKLKD